MPLDPDMLELPFDGCAFGVSARRIHEHMTQAQINPFDRPAASCKSLGDAAALIDVVEFESPDAFRLTGLTLASLGAACTGTDRLRAERPAVLLAAASESVRDFTADVLVAIGQHALRRSMRNAPTPFLPLAAANDPFGVPGLRSRLIDLLTPRARAKAVAEQWQGTIRNLAAKGLRSEELQRSGLMEVLDAKTGDRTLLTGDNLMRAVDFSALRLSVIQSVDEARTQLRFEPAAVRAVPGIKGEARPQTGQRRHLRLFDRVLGYRIEEVEHPALWGNDRHWQAITYRGTVLRNRFSRRSIFGSRDDAMARAQEHAVEVLPKLVPAERWVAWAWTGGEDYREWLVTLPCFPTTFLSPHFDVRNVLAHVRCDVREGADGERVLLLHEVQSDWMQGVRRQIQECGELVFLEEETPFLRDWPALTLKLVLLHAAHRGVDAVAWTRGAHQAHRYRGRGRDGLKELYDRTLPREANRMLKPFGVACGSVEIYVPDNFSIRRLEAGYEVRDKRGTVLGVAPSFAQARALLPDGAHEKLYTLHGVRLDKANRAEIVNTGFAAWG